MHETAQGCESLSHCKINADRKQCAERKKICINIDADVIMT